MNISLPSPSASCLFVQGRDFLDPSLCLFLDPSLCPFLDPSLCSFLDPSLCPFLDTSLHPFLSPYKIRREICDSIVLGHNTELIRNCTEILHKYCFYTIDSWT